MSISVVAVAAIAADQTAGDSRTLILYGTAGCHLCDEALALVLAEPRLAGWALDTIDIAFDEQLLATYGERIPVLICTARSAVLDWPFDAADLTALLTS